MTLSPTDRAKIIERLIHARQLLSCRSGTGDYTLEVRLINEALELLGVDPREPLEVDFRIRE